MKFRIATSDQEPAKIRRQPEPVFQRLHRFSNPLKFKLVGNVYQKTVPENQLEVNLENECEFLIQFHLRNLCHLTYPDNATFQPS